MDKITRWNKFWLITAALCVIGALILILSGCALEQSEDTPMNIYITGVGSDNITMNYYTTNITNSTTSNLTGILTANGSGVIAYAFNGTPVASINTQWLTNKTIDADSNTISNLEHGSEVDNLTTSHGATGAVVGTTNAQTLTNKTIGAFTVDGLITTGGNDLNSGSDHLELYTSGEAKGFYTQNSYSGAAGSRLKLYHISPTPNDNDYQDIWVAFTDNESNQFLGVREKFIITDVSDTTEDAKIEWSLVNNGSTNLAMYLDGTGNLWVDNNMSALSFTDRTKWYQGDAVKLLSDIKGKYEKGKYVIDHDTLPNFTQAIKVYPIYDTDGNNIIGYETLKERDLGATISMLTVAIKQLNERIEYLESKVK